MNTNNLNDNIRTCFANKKYTTQTKKIKGFNQSFKYYWCIKLPISFGTALDFNKKLKGRNFLPTQMTFLISY